MANTVNKARGLKKGKILAIGLLGTILLVSALVLGTVTQVFAQPYTEKLTLENQAIPQVGSLVTTPTNQTPEEPARYSLASVQGATQLQVAPGGETTAIIRFYNIDGNRTTYITLEVTQAPEGWQVEVTPSLQVEPQKLSADPIQDVPQGTIALQVPNRGYTLARVATITIRVPELQKAGTTGDVKIAATASWLGQGGTAAISQARTFSYRITTQG